MEALILLDTTELLRVMPRKLHAAWAELCGTKARMPPTVADELAPYFGRPGSFSADNRDTQIVGEPSTTVRRFSLGCSDLLERAPSFLPRYRARPPREAFCQMTTLAGPAVQSSFPMSGARHLPQAVALAPYSLPRNIRPQRESLRRRCSSGNGTSTQRPNPRQTPPLPGRGRLLSCTSCRSRLRVRRPAAPDPFALDPALQARQTFSETGHGRRQPPVQFAHLQRQRVNLTP